MKFNYYYGSEADQFSFIRIPKIMLIDKVFQTLSMAAKVLYGVLLDRMSLSMKNGWLDEENRVYIIYQIGEIQEDLGFTKKRLWIFWRNWKNSVCWRRNGADMACQTSCM